MASQTPQPAEETLHNLHRLSQKPGVQSTLILSRDTGAIVRASGLLVSKAPLAADGSAIASSKEMGDNTIEDTDEGHDAASGRQLRQKNGKTSSKSAEDVARTVWAFFGAAGGMVNDMMGEGEDEVRLLRLRMKRCELMIVPDARFLLVVIHDTPPA